MPKQQPLKLKILVLSLALTLCLPLAALAKGAFPGTFQSLYGYAIDCTYCHPNFNYSSFTSYGRDFRNVYTTNGKNVTNAFHAIEALDSDADGFNNIDEITAQTLAYDASDYPASVPTCTDRDSDGFAVEGGDCGPVDCNDSDPSAYPGATESCSDGVDNNCDGRVDCLDNSCSSDAACLSCTDLDNDQYAVEGADCGPIDCNDNDLAVNPGAVELCDDNLDNDCDGLTDCQDADCNGSSACAGICIPEATAEKGKKCKDGIDNDCDGQIDSADADCVRTKGGGKRRK